jgi:hypothetical protein
MKSYRGGHLVRRIRRALERAGHPAEVSLVARPEWCHQTTPFLIETRLTHDGEIHVLHHAAKIPTRADAVDRIIERTLAMKGVPLSMIEERIARCGPTHDRSAGWLVLERSGSDPLLLVPTTMYDVLRRRWDMIMSFPHSCGRMVPGDTMLEPIVRTHIDADARRRDAKGDPTSVMIGGLLAEVLRRHEDGADILMRVIPSLEEALDEADKGNTSSAVTVDRVTSGAPISGMKWTLKDRLVHLKHYDRPQWSISGDTLVIKQAFPQTVVDGLIGKRLGDVIEGLPLDAELIIRRARLRRSPWSGIGLGLSAKAVHPDDLARELKAGMAEGDR